MIGFTSIQLRAAYAYAQASFQQRTFWTIVLQLMSAGSPMASRLPIFARVAVIVVGAWTAFAIGLVRAQDAALRIIGVIFTVFLLAAINTLVH